MKKLPVISLLSCFFILAAAMSAYSGVTETPTPICGFTLGINCGDYPSVYTASDGKIYQPDQPYSSGSWGYQQTDWLPFDTAGAVSGTADQALYQYSQFNQFLYDSIVYKITVPNGSYKVVLKMAELADNDRNSEVIINSVDKGAIDPLTDSGANLTAIDYTFAGNAVTDGLLTITLKSNSYVSILNALWIEQENGPCGAVTPSETFTPAAPTATDTPATSTDTPVPPTVTDTSIPVTITNTAVSATWTDTPSTVAPTDTPSVLTVTATPTPSSGACAFTLGINCGDYPSVYTASDGKIYQPDQPYSSGSWGYQQTDWLPFDTAQAVTGTADPALYQHSQFDQFPGASIVYKVTVPDGSYKVVLKMAEIAVSQRDSEIIINGVDKGKIDPMTDAGGNYRAIDYTYTGNAVTGGLLTIEVKSVSFVSILNAIWIEQDGAACGTATIIVATNTPSTLTVTATPTPPSGACAFTLGINCGDYPSVYTASDGKIYQPDQPYSSGSWGYQQTDWLPFDTAQAVTGTADPALYQHSQFDQFPGASIVYKVTVPNGNYKVVLKMAEIAVSQRDSEIIINGVDKGKIDPMTDAGGNYRAIDYTYTGNAVTGGLLTIEVKSVSFVSILNAIWIEQDGAACGTATIIVATDTPSAVTVTATPTPPSGACAFTLGINCGDYPSVYTASDGKIYQPDQPYSSGSWGYQQTDWLPFDTAQSVTGTADPALYQHSQFDQFPGASIVYKVTVPNGNYKVVLKMAEIAVSQRDSEIIINGVDKGKIDPMTDAGGNYRAIDYTYAGNAVTGGLLTIEVKSVSFVSILNAVWIEQDGAACGTATAIVPTDTPTAVTVSGTPTPSAGLFTLGINCGDYPSVYTASDGKIYQPDQPYSSGSWGYQQTDWLPFDTDQAVTCTADPALYQHSQFDQYPGASIVYKVTVPDGSYKVVLKMAEIAVSQRDSEIIINGVDKGKIDPMTDAGDNYRAIDYTYAGNAVTGGLLTIEVKSVSFVSILNAVWIEQEDTGLSSGAIKGFIPPGNYSLLSKSGTYFFPNPSAGDTSIRFVLDKPRDVHIAVMDISGKMAWQENIGSANTRAGVNIVRWDGHNDSGAAVSNGIYLVTLNAGGKALTKKLAIVR